MDQKQKFTDILTGLLNRRIVPSNIFAILILLNGILITVETLTERFGTRFNNFYEFLPVEIHYYHKLISAVIGISLIYLSINLFARKRLAYAITLILLLIDAFLDINLRHFTIGATSSTLLFLLFLLRSRDFPVKIEPYYISRGLIIFLSSIIFSVFYGTLGFYLLMKRDFSIESNLRESFIRTIKEFSLIGNADLIPRTRNARWFLDSLDLIGATSMAIGIYNFFRPIAYKLRVHPQEIAEVQKIVQKYGKDELDYFKMRPDKSYFFSNDRQSVITYRTVSAIAVVLGDPVGPKEQLPNLIKKFVGWSNELGWRPVFIATEEDLLGEYKKLKLSKLKIGEEANVNLNYFLQNTIKKKDFRRVLNKFDQLNFKTKYETGPHSAETINQLTRITQSWLTIENHKELTFAAGYFDPTYLNRTPLFYVLDPSGKMIAFVNEIPAFRKGMATIDLMRHEKDVPNGMMDYLFTKYFIDLEKRGYKYFNLGLAPLSGYSQTKGSYQEQIVFLLINYLNRFFAFGGLRSYKEKFDPVWENRYLIYQGTPLALLPISLAIQKVMERK